MTMAIGRFPGFANAWEADFTDYTYRFVWCCMAIKWAIETYDTINRNKKA